VRDVDIYKDGTGLCVVKKNPRVEPVDGCAILYICEERKELQVVQGEKGIGK